MENNTAAGKVKCLFSEHEVELKIIDEKLCKIDAETEAIYAKMKVISDAGIITKNEYETYLFYSNKHLLLVQNGIRLERKQRKITNLAYRIPNQLYSAPHGMMISMFPQISTF